MVGLSQSCFKIRSTHRYLVIITITRMPSRHMHPPILLLALYELAYMSTSDGNIKSTPKHAATVMTDSYQFSSLGSAESIPHQFIRRRSLLMLDIKCMPQELLRFLTRHIREIRAGRVGITSRTASDFEDRLKLSEVGMRV